MEDAMVINKSSFERGFGHGTIYKSEFVELNDKKSYFARNTDKPELAETLDIDGLPIPGCLIKEGDAYYSYYDADNAHYVVGTYKSTESAYVDNVKLCGTFNSQDVRKACITFRVPVSTIYIKYIFKKLFSTNNFVFLNIHTRKFFREILPWETNSHQEQDKRESSRGYIPLKICLSQKLE